jgi:quercetin dioxygenase-like cupin family protein
MIQVKIVVLGDLKTSIYDFPNINDVLPMHVHDDVTNHITVVARGSFRAHGNGWEKTVVAGDVLDWQPHDPHEFIALEEQSRLVNIIKNIIT